MRIKRNRVLTFGDFITAAYQVWGVGRAEEMIRLAINVRLVVFREQPLGLIAYAKGKSI